MPSGWFVGTAVFGVSWKFVACCVFGLPAFLVQLQWRSSGSPILLIVLCFTSPTDPSCFLTKHIFSIRCIYTCHSFSFFYFPVSNSELCWCLAESPAFIKLLLFHNSYVNKNKQGAIDFIPGSDCRTPPPMCLLWLSQTANNNIQKTAASV